MIIDQIKLVLRDANLLNDINDVNYCLCYFLRILQVCFLSCGSWAKSNSHEQTRADSMDGPVYLL